MHTERGGACRERSEQKTMSSLPRPSSLRGAPLDEDRAATPQSELRRRIEDQTAVVGIVGLGYVGLPLALAAAERGSRVVGFDVDAAKVRSLSAGKSPIRHLGGGRLKTALRSERFSATECPRR